MAAQLLGLRATVYVPVTAPEIKVKKIEGFGAEVVRTGSGFDECLANARQEQAVAASNSTFVHPFDDYTVAAGQGTLGIELFEHLSSTLKTQRVHAVRVFVPIGGGGLIAGIASTLRELWHAHLPQLQIIGVVDESSPASLVGTLFGRPVRAFPDTIADGTRVAQVGETFLSVCRLVDFIMPVPHDAIVTTMRQYHERTGEILEPSGALALAGEALTRRYSLLPQMRSSLQYAVVSGRNVDQATFESVVSKPARRSEFAQSRLGYQIHIPERDGELLRLLNAVRDFNIASLTYKQRSSTSHGALQVHFEVPHASAIALHDRLVADFPGSRPLSSVRSLLLPVDEPVAEQFQDDLITLEDRPGSFANYVQGLNDAQTLGSVGFLFYRQPSQPGARAQVIVGRAPTAPAFCVTH